MDVGYKVCNEFSSMDKKLREITNLGVEMMNSKRQVKRKLVGSRSTTTRLPFDINMIHKPPT